MQNPKLWSFQPEGKKYMLIHINLRCQEAYRYPLKSCKKILGQDISTSMFTNLEGTFGLMARGYVLGSIFQGYSKSKIAKGINNTNALSLEDIKKEMDLSGENHKLKRSMQFTAALFTEAKTWKQPNCPSTEEWIKKM